MATPFPLLRFALALAFASLTAAAPATDIPELTALKQQYEQLHAERVQKVHDEAISKLNSSYLEGLERERAAAQKAADFPAILEFGKEAERWMTGKTLPPFDADGTPAGLKRLRAIYREQITKAQEQRAANTVALLDPYLLRLRQVEIDLERKNRPKDAAIVLEYRVALEEQRTSLGKPPIPQSFTNSLGMKFAPVPGTNILLCIHETRRADYAAYAAETPSLDNSWKNQAQDGVKVGAEDNHPVVSVSWQEAQEFCSWLSKKDKGRIYRLPTDREWSYAVGIGPQEEKLRTKTTTPNELHEKVRDFYPWGPAWPLPSGAGNYADATLRAKFPEHGFFDSYTDGFITTAPVMSFKPNGAGFHDLGGNVWEWCHDWATGENQERVLRGGSWRHFERVSALASHRFRRGPEFRNFGIGFRCAIEVQAVPTP